MRDRHMISIHVALLIRTVSSPPLLLASLLLLIFPLGGDQGRNNEGRKEGRKEGKIDEPVGR